jgi:protein O-GlcNAc transferase
MIITSNYDPVAMKSAQEIFQQGRQARQEGNLTAAREYFQAAIRLEPNYVPAYNNLANILQAQGQIPEAIEIYERALALDPNLAALHCNLASLWQVQGELDRAISGYQRAIDLQPDFFVAYHNLGKGLVADGQFTAAGKAYQSALRLDPNSAALQLDLGDLYRQQGSIEQAIDCYRTAIRCEPQSATAYNSLGACLWLLHEVKLSQAAYQRALGLDPNYEAAHFNLAQLLESLGQLETAQQHYQRSLELKPDATNVLYHLNHIRLKLADWHNYAERVAEIIASTKSHLERPQSVGLPPLTLAAFPVPIDLQLAVARHHAQFQTQLVKGIQVDWPSVSHELTPARLRIGYVSPDFRCHAVGTLIHEMFQYHHRPDFEIFAYSLVPVDDAWTATIRQGCDHYINVAYQSPLSIAQRIQADGIQILVDLAGYTTNSCTSIFALQPAPIQVQYLGYPGTMGADFIQYIVADEQIIPLELTEYYHEEVIDLPHAWCSSPMEIAPTTTTRADWGLPLTSTVFCCFNAIYKIDPTVFASWMRILQQVPGSVLWLADSSQPLVVERLRQKAVLLGVDPNRLVFAPNLPHAEYLARYRLADLFLDTFIYNAGATAIGALWTGLPVLTCPGETYVSRMGSGLCDAVGMPELICDSIEQYEQIAIELGNHPDLIRSLKDKLALSVVDTPLFKPQLFIGQLERSFRQIWRAYVNEINHRISAIVREAFP